MTRGFFYSVLYGFFQFLNSISADRVVLQTEELKNYVWFEGIIKNKIRVVPNCLAVTSDEMKKIFYQRFSTTVPKTKTINLLFVGNFSLGKGAQQFLSLIELIHRKGIAVDARIVGHIPDNMMDVDRQRFVRLQSIGALQFMGKLEQRELFELMQVCHYIIHFSICDGSARAVLEAMGRGVVPVVLEHPGLDFVENSGCGLVYKSSIPDELSRVAGEMIEAKVKDPDRWREMAIGNLRFVEQNRSLGAVSTEWLSLVGGK